MILARYKRLTGIFTTLSIIYIAATVLTPQDKAALAKYHVSGGQVTGLVLTIALPYLIIWFIALVGYLRLRSYSQSISDSKDGRAFQLISRGVLLLALWLPLSAVIGALTTWYTRLHPSATPEMVTINNFANIIILFVAFLIINQSSKHLLSLVKKSEAALPQLHMVLFICFSALYVFMVLHDPARQFPTATVHQASYYLPDWLTVTTLVIPRLIMWFLGIQAVHNIYVYRNKVKGAIYKEALDSLARGIGWVVVSVIILRCFQSLSSQWDKLSLAVLLLVIYGLLVFISVGYVLIAKGARNLQRIEEI